MDPSPKTLKWGHSMGRCSIQFVVTFWTNPPDNIFNFHLQNRNWQGKPCNEAAFPLWEMIKTNLFDGRRIRKSCPLLLKKKRVNLNAKLLYAWMFLQAQKFCVTILCMFESEFGLTTCFSTNDPTQVDFDANNIFWGTVTTFTVAQWPES